MTALNMLQVSFPKGDVTDGTIIKKNDTLKHYAQCSVCLFANNITTEDLSWVLQYHMMAVSHLDKIAALLELAFEW